MAKKDNRFIFSKNNDESNLGFGSNAQVVVDRKTGVNYLFVNSGYSGGLTVLLDREGKPIITTVTDLD